MLNRHPTRRVFLQHAAAATTVLAAGLDSLAVDAQSPPPPPAKFPPAAPHTLTRITGTPLERGRAYGEKFGDGIRRFLEKEIYATLSGGPTTRDAMLRYAGACAKEVAAFSPEIMQELEGISTAAGLRVEEAVLITLHEELWHRGVLPPTPHCSAVAAGPPDTADGSTYVGQTWDWMPSVYGMSEMLLWERGAKSPSVLAYAYPGLWVGAGMNSAGLALCWTSGTDPAGPKFDGPRVGIPAYLLLTQMLYQPTLEAALDEARRAKHAGWFTFVLANDKGDLANVEGTPGDVAIETTRGYLARVSYGSRKMTGTADGNPVKHTPRCRRLYEVAGAARGKIDRDVLQGFFALHAEGTHEGVCNHASTIDAMLLDTTRREAYVTRGPACSGKWKRFSFVDALVK